ncbi:polysaccharide pyruvyl transferase family protein [Salipaludibacillus agaradhaerens]|uniref:polysaccharide pyruvyl transferase family protein n=1 Tax=Salipaludibacillus agaradhaerens TaxID=76935 RepID=UPI002151A7F2|nr:polysaccharide pyruvyl transferase family protein [Salipaludibacillus agaradhaerens]MCR6108133.1 polysaccharide pyruvyl transferase family protein [Salipaludibacillus agaradhaerens]MCR6120158.1 polysaccharide pyruvyl transferase family protein [Salipaludibacillus agaradhaerens]
MIALHGAYENENFGDELLLAIQGKWINELINKKVILPFAADYYREQIPSSHLVGRDSLMKSEKLVYGGGGYFGEPNHSKLKWGINFFRKGHHKPAKIVKAANKEYIIVGVGAGPISNLLTRREVVNICNGAKHVVIRDEESYDYLLRYGVDKHKMSVAADIVLSLREDDLPTKYLEETNKLIKRGEGKTFFGIHIGVSPEDQHYGKNITLAIDSLVDYVNNHAHIIPVLIADKRHSKVQEEAISYVTERLNKEAIVYRHYNIWATTSLLGVLDGVVTTKLHVGITAFSLGTKTFGIAAHQKTRRFYEQIGKENYFYELKDINHPIIDDIQAFFEDAYWDENTNEKRRRLKSLALKNREVISNFIKDMS